VNRLFFSIFEVLRTTLTKPAITPDML